MSQWPILFSSLLGLQAPALKAEKVESARTDGLHLRFGFSPVFIQSLRAGRGPINFGGAAFNSAVWYQFASVSLGVKSIAALGLQGQRPSGPFPFSVARRIQFVSLSPFVEYKFSLEIFERHRVFVGVGPALSLTSFAYNERPVRQGEAVESKIVSRGQGIDISVGLLGTLSASGYTSYMALNYLSVRPKPQSVVNAGDFNEPARFKNARESDLEHVQVLSLNFGLFLI